MSVRLGPALRRTASLEWVPGVAGVDEAGRGPLAGPVAVAAVLFGETPPPAGLDDSKKLAPARREALFGEIVERAAAVAIVFADAGEIDRTDIRAATLRAMARAVAALAVRPSAVRIDGRDVPRGLDPPAQAIVGGDAVDAAIAAASILAKVARDRAMVLLARAHPGYGFDVHKGYGTAAHLEALARLGPSPVHRLSFAPCAEAAAHHETLR